MKLRKVTNCPFCDSKEFEYSFSTQEHLEEFDAEKYITVNQVYGWDSEFYDMVIVVKCSNEHMFYVSEEG